jgi:hypothetical protein
MPIHTKNATATGMLATVGVLKTEGTSVTADKSKTSNSSWYNSNIWSVSNSGTLPAADIPITSQTSNSSRDDSNGRLF